MPAENGPPPANDNPMSPKRRMESFRSYVAEQTELRTALVEALTAHMAACADPYEAIALYRLSTPTTGGTDTEWLVTAAHGLTTARPKASLSQRSIFQTCAAFHDELQLVDSVTGGASQLHENSEPTTDDELHGLLVAADLSRPVVKLSYLESWVDNCLLPHVVVALREQGLNWPKQPRLLITAVKRVASWSFEPTHLEAIDEALNGFTPDDYETSYATIRSRHGGRRLTEVLRITSYPNSPDLPNWALPALLEWMLRQLVDPHAFNHSGAHFVRSPDHWMLLDHRWLGTTLLSCINRALRGVQLHTTDPTTGETVQHLYTRLRDEHLERYTGEVLDRSIGRPPDHHQSVLNLEARYAPRGKPPVPITEIDVVARGGDLVVRTQCKAGDLDLDFTRSNFSHLLSPWRNNLAKALDQVRTHRLAASGTYVTARAALPVDWHGREGVWAAQDALGLLRAPIEADLVVTITDPGLCAADPTSIPRLLDLEASEDPPFIMSISELENICVLARPDLARYLLWRRWVQRHEPHWVADDRVYLAYWIAGHHVIPMAPFTAPSEGSYSRAFLSALLHQPALEAADALLRGEEVPRTFLRSGPTFPLSAFRAAIAEGHSWLDGGGAESLRAVADLLLYVTNPVVTPRDWEPATYVRAAIYWSPPSVPIFSIGAPSESRQAAVDYIARFSEATGLEPFLVSDVVINLRDRSAEGGWVTADPRAVIEAIVATPPPEPWKDLYERRHAGMNVGLGAQPRERLPDIPIAHIIRGSHQMARVEAGQSANALCGKSWTPGVDPTVLPLCPDCGSRYAALVQPPAQNRSMRRRQPRRKG